MKNFLLLVFLFASFSNKLFPQHLPHQIGNQWHYDMTIMPPGIDYVAIAVDTVLINNKTYFKFERRDANTGELLEITYDRLEGDSVYYRNYNGEDNLKINFNWNEGFTRVTTSDSICFNFNRLINIGQHNIWGFITQSYHFIGGFWCVGMQDTAWVLFVTEITRELGCYNDADGWLKGAIINGVPYGDLYPVSIEEQETFPTEFSLSQNYPNPFNPTTKIKFTIPTSPLNPSPYQGEGQRERLITLKVYDVLGNEIATLVNEEKLPGSYEVEFNATELPSGVYFYRLTASSFLITKKMSLLK